MSLTVDQATALLPDGERIMVMTRIEPPYGEQARSRLQVLEALKSSQMIDTSGPVATAHGYGLCYLDNRSNWIFVETKDKEK